MNCSNAENSHWHKKSMAMNVPRVIVSNTMSSMGLQASDFSTDNEKRKRIKMNR